MNTAIKTQSLFAASIVAASFLAFGGAVMGGKAQAAEAPQFYTVVVRYGDLNLESEQGAKVLYARLRNAAKNVCHAFEGRDFVEKRLWHDCFDKALASAVTQLNRTIVTALHNQAVNHSTKG